MSQPILAISYFFHLVATVIWLGGLLVLSVWVFPEAQKQLRAHPARYQLVNRLRKRFTPWANFSLVILIASGMFQMSADQQYLGMLNFSNSWSRALLWKHIAMLGMLVCSLTLQYGLAPRLERVSLLIQHQQGNEDQWERLHGQEIRLAWLNMFFGFMILGLTAWMTSL